MFTLAYELIYNTPRVFIYNRFTTLFIITYWLASLSKSLELFFGNRNTRFKSDWRSLIWKIKNWQNHLDCRFFHFSLSLSTRLPHYPQPHISGKLIMVFLKVILWKSQYLFPAIENLYIFKYENKRIGRIVLIALTFYSSPSLSSTSYSASL